MPTETPIPGMFLMPRLLVPLPLPLLCLVLAAGCYQPEEPGVAVSGRVNYRGKPVKEATIFFTPDIDKKGKGGHSEIRDGHYSIPPEEGPYPGEFNVMIVGPQDAMGKPAPSNDPPIPERYRNFNELRVAIPERKKSYSFDFELRDEADKPLRELKPGGPVD
jgi:hypothetical protein